MKLDQLFQQYISSLTIDRGLAANTVEAYRRDITDYCAYLKSIGIDSIEAVNKEHIYDYIALQLNDKHKSSVSRMISAVRSFHHFATQYDTKLRDPAASIRTIRKTRYLPRYFHKTELDKLFDSFSDENPKDIYHHTILELLYACGMRVSELCSLKINQYDRTNRFIKVIGKGNKERLVPIAGFSAALLNRYIDEVRILYNKHNLNNLFINRLGKPLTRQYVGIVLKSKEKELGLDLKFSPHSFRHTYATDLLANRADLRVVQELLGHSDITTTQIYTHVEQKQLHDSYDRFHPGSKRSKEK